MRLATVLLASILVAGCTATGPSPTSTDRSPTTHCGSGTLETSIGLTSEVRRDYPDEPDEINRSSVREHVKAFERAYAWNREYNSGQEELHIHVHGVDVESRDDGYVVHVDEVKISQYFGDNSIGDYAWSAHYFVNESVVERGEGHAGGPGPNEAQWESIQC